MNTIITKVKTTTGAPTAGQLSAGELCFVDPDNALYIKKQDNSIEHLNPAGGGGGYTPEIVQRNRTGTTNLGTALATIPFDNSQIDDGGLSYSAGEFTVLSAWNGKRVRVDWSIGGNGATNRVEIRSELQLNSTVVKEASNYTARNSAQNTGGISGFCVLTVSTNDVIRVQALRDGSNCNNIPDETMITFTTLS